MQATEKSKQGGGKKKSVLARIGITLLLLLLIPIVLVGALYLYTTFADFEYDDPLQVVSQGTQRSFSQQNSFDSENMTRTMLLDNSDLYYLSAGSIPELSLNESVYVKSYRLSLEDRAVYIQGKAYGINVPIKLVFDLSWKNGSIALNVQNAYWGKLCIPLPLKWIADKFEFELAYEIPMNDQGMLKDVKNMVMEGGYLKVTFPVDRNILKDGLSAWVYLKPAVFYMKEPDALISLIEDIQKHWTEEGYTSEKLVSFLKACEQNPETYQEMLVKMLAAAPAKKADEYFLSEDYKSGLSARFYPGVTPAAVENMRGQLQYERNYLFLRNYAFTVDEQYGSQEITIRNRKFVSLKTGKEVDFKSFYEGSPEALEVLPEGTEFCAVFCEGADSRQKIEGAYYASGTAIKFLNGRCAVLCKKDDQAYMTEITPEQFEDLASGKVEYYIVKFVG